MLRRVATIAAYAAAAAIAALATVNSVDLWYVAEHRRTRSFDYVSAYLNSFQASKARLANENVVGYYSSRKVDVTGGGDPAKWYYLAQYALAPVLVDHRSKGRQVVLVNLPPDRIGRLDDLRKRPDVATLEPVDVPGRAILTRGQP